MLPVWGISTRRAIPLHLAGWAIWVVCTRVEIQAVNNLLCSQLGQTRIEVLLIEGALVELLNWRAGIRVETVEIDTDLFASRQGRLGQVIPFFVAGRVEQNQSITEFAKSK
jgi:hypothetical protein